MDSTLPVFSALMCVMAILWLVFAAMISRAYVKAPAGRAFVRTGGFFRMPYTPPKVVMNGGAWVFNLIHSITWVDLSTMNIEIERAGQNALFTQDLLPVDIYAIFHVQVNPTIEGIVDAARTMGGKAVDAAAVKPLVEAKLTSALRDVVATFPFVSLHQETDKVRQEILKRVKDNLEGNGLVLESVSILTLKAPQQYLDAKQAAQAV